MPWNAGVLERWAPPAAYPARLDGDRVVAETCVPDDRAECYLVGEWSDAWSTTVVSRRTPELHDVIAGATCVVMAGIWARHLLQVDWNGMNGREKVRRVGAYFPGVWLCLPTA